MRIRTFIAVNIPEDVREEIKRAQETLRMRWTEIKWVEPENIHITLEFLGNVEAGDIERLKEALTRGLEGERKFSLRTKSLGAFPSPSSPRVIWVGVEGEGIRRLHKKVEGIVRGLGLKVEEREFSPHITIGRVKRMGEGERRRLGEEIRRLPFSEKSFIIDRVNIMRSDLTPSGPIYTVLHEVVLK